MKYWALMLVFFLVLPGCMTLQEGCAIPYEHPYVRTYEASPTVAYDAVICALARLHRLPVDVYQYPESGEYYARIFTDQKLRFWIIYTTSNQMNIYLKPRSENQTDVVILYQRSRALGPFYDFAYCKYTNDEYVERVFSAISESLH